ncbi:unnamed protein product [Strongylus vulgaris]|uniref:Uncharacterized protein n=1 Tax=Strongylus vulgaris TaxID=40348 RepID=A0A3P7JET0_STRVU|nr:unnamed protein product [Strongylus vulgaris]
MKHAANTCVKKAKKAYVEELYKKLESRDGERDIYRIARGRAESGKDVRHFYDVKELSSTTSIGTAIPPADPVKGPVPRITAEEV